MEVFFSDTVREPTDYAAGPMEAAMTSHKLSNVMLKVDDHMSAYPQAYYRAEGSATFDAGALAFSGTVDFLTYFNACSVKKWRTYAEIESVRLRLVLSGDRCMLRFRGIASGDDEPTSLGEDLILKEDEACCVRAEGDRFIFDVSLPESDKDIVAFELESSGATKLHEAYYHADVDDADNNPVRLALATTTFKKEQYIVPNIGLVKREVLGSGDPIAEAFHMFVVDNGRTLDAEELSDDGVTVLPNPNVGGAGGFARGMMEALASEEGFTHVLLMDDDVIVSPESLKRTFNLLVLAKGRYRSAFINGAMLAVEEPNLQFEDVSFVRDTGAYARIKEDLHIDRAQDIADNEAISVEVPKAYGAWWYSCIPLSVVREKGLPLPLFVRCDDVEYGMRAEPVYMTMNGICVWHEGFEGRFRPSVDCYQYVRNFLIMIAMDDCASEKLFVTRLGRNIRLHLRTMSYDTVELFLDGFEDYLKGPDYLAHVSGEKLMKTNGAKNEKLVPVGELDQDTIASLKIVPGNLDGGVRKDSLLKLWRTLPYDRHYLPDAFLRDRPEAVFYSGLSTLGAYTMGAKTLVALDLGGKNGCVRHMDKDRWRGLKRRWSDLKKDYRARGDKVRASYKAAKPYLVSWEFWNEYLGTDLNPRG